MVCYSGFKAKLEAPPHTHTPASAGVILWKILGLQPFAQQCHVQYPYFGFVDRNFSLGELPLPACRSLSQLCSKHCKVEMIVNLHYCCLHIIASCNITAFIVWGLLELGNKYFTEWHCIPHNLPVGLALSGKTYIRGRGSGETLQPSDAQVSGHTRVQSNTARWA